MLDFPQQNIRKEHFMKEFCKKHTLIFIIMVILYALMTNLATGFLQNCFAENITSFYIVQTICKCTFSLLPLILMVKWGYHFKTDKQKMRVGFFLGSICMLYYPVTNLLPLILLEVNYFSIRWKIVMVAALAAFSVGLLEETAIRGVLFPFFCEKWKDKKHALLKAAFFSSFLFGCIHLNWSVRFLLINHTLSTEELAANLYQVYYAFCFGIFATGVTVYAKSIWPMVFWHGICDFSAFIIDGLIPQVSLNHFYNHNILSLQRVLDTYSILPGCSFGAELIQGIINFIFVIVGIVLIKKAEKVQR